MLASMGTGLVVITPSYTIITVGTFFVGVGWSCINIGATALYADTTVPEERGRVVGANDTFTAASAIMMPLVGGTVLEYFGLAVLGLLGVVMMIPASVLLIRLKESTPGTYQH